MELKADKFIKDCKVTKEDWQTYLDRGTLEHIVANMLMTYHQEQVKTLNIDDVSNCCCISRNTLTPEARKMFDDIDKALERK